MAGGGEEWGLLPGIELGIGAVVMLDVAADEVVVVAARDGFFAGIAEASATMEGPMAGWAVFHALRLSSIVLYLSKVIRYISWVNMSCSAVASATPFCCREQRRYMASHCDSVKRIDTSTMPPFCAAAKVAPKGVPEPDVSSMENLEPAGATRFFRFPDAARVDSFGCVLPQ